MVFDVAVIGMGLVGSAALRHLSASGLSAVGIGPGEPENWSTHAGPFASHYDSGRITRRLDARYEWAVLASRSIEQYPVIEKASGLRFHRPVGFLFVRNDEAGIKQQRQVIDRLNLPVAISGTSDSEFDEFMFPSGWTVLHESGPAGHIDPRLMAQAQLIVSGRQGAVTHSSYATALERFAGGFRIRTHDGREFEAGRVLLATGPYLNDLLARPLAAQVVPEAVVLAQVDEGEAGRLAEMPTVVYLLDHAVHDDVYLVPPVRYPDGRWYLKMGASIAGARALESAEDKRAWMGGSAAYQQLESMRNVLERMLPGVAFESFAMKPCLITDTAHGLPFVDEVEDGLVVAAGGNGHAAKSADAIGALGAGLTATGEWRDLELDRSSFTAVFDAFRRVSGSRHGN
ncbi:MAG: FAD-dependent oxidoreductase [Acidimicrobiia bacterium]|nr:FAD-dependent oxidoreductase [Acidimicrobiia bacterium]